MADRPHSLRPQSLAWGAAGAAVVTVAVIGRVVQRGYPAVYLSDGQYYLLVARSPFGNGAALRPVAPIAGDAYRYGRILLPLLSWALALGHAGATKITSIVVDVCAYGLCVAVAAEVVLRRHWSPLASLLILAPPAVLTCLLIVVTEPVVLGLLLLACLFAVDGKRGACWAALALALLAKEEAGVVVIALALYEARRHAWRVAAAWSTAVVPLLCWWTWVRHQVGAWPFLEPSHSHDEAAAPPFVGYWRLLEHGIGAHTPARGGQIADVVLVALTIAAAVVTFTRHSNSPFAWAGLALALVGLIYNDFSLALEIVRLLAPAQAMIVVALIAGPTPDDTPRTLGGGGLVAAPGLDAV